MSGPCISFSKLCEYNDSELETSEIENVKKHIESCRECHLEYIKLKNMMELFSEIKSEKYHLDSICRKVLKESKSREIKKKIRSYLPYGAVAASVLFFALFGLSLFNRSSDERGTVAVRETEAKSVSGNESGKVIDIIRSSGASITRVSDEFVEGEVQARSFHKLRRNLGFRKVQYSFKDDGLFYDDDSRTGKNIEEVAAGNVIHESSRPVKESERYLKFRVYK